MNEPSRPSRNRSGRNALTGRPADRDPGDRDPGDLAPSVERRWVQEFVLEQRLLGVAGPRIGDALVTVESHVVESGEGAQEAFGDARVYARALAEAESRDEGAVSPATATWAVLGLVGMLLTGWGFDAWLDGEAADVSVGVLVGGAFALTSLGALLLAPTMVLRALVSRIWVGAVLLMIPVLAMVVATVLLPATAFRAPAPLLVGSGLVLVAVAAVLSWLDHAPDDLVLAPGEEPTVTARSRLRLALVTPAFTLGLLALLGALHLLG
ncbi:MAG TPA: hypothetical protein VLO09_09060 [Ornithinimicrobium sp.]|nr:hypothetical protein [Ornithinimicrobium sp.]